MVRVKVSQGWLEGERLETVTGDGSYYSFKGIPYACPPIGKLRFKAPQPPVNWDGVRKATEYGNVCPQMDLYTQQINPSNEDCLYLNVYTPEMKPQTPLPVMFFIHGGGFKSGSGNDDFYGPDLLMNHGVVLVTINYRLEALGFLCLDTAEISGNAGLKDQVAALKWVKENVAHFGGDPNDITIFGESAGGTSVALHVVSPMSKGLFQKAIIMSGAPSCDWAISHQPLKRAFVLGKQLGIDTCNKNELIEYLQSLSVEKLLNTNPTVLASEEIADNVLRMYHFTPVVEKDYGQERFLPEEPTVLLKTGKINDADIFIGHTNGEGMFGIPYFESSLLKLYDRYPELLVPREISIKSAPNTILELSGKIHNHYFSRKPINVNIMREYIKYASEASFVYDIHRYMNKLPKVGNCKRYFYKFSCFSERNFFGKQGVKYGLQSASHLDDLMYLFQGKNFNLTSVKNTKEYDLIQFVCTIFTNFAKYGTPTPDSSLGLIWPEYNNETKSFVEIGDTLTLGRNSDEESISFWKSIYEGAGLEF